MLIQQKHTPPVLLFSFFAGWISEASVFITWFWNCSNDDFMTDLASSLQDTVTEQVYKKAKRGESFRLQKYVRKKPQIETL